MIRGKKLGKKQHRDKWEETQEKQNISTEVALHIKAQQRERVSDKEAERQREVGGDVTFHLATIATLDACEKPPLHVPFDVRQACTTACDC